MEPILYHSTSGGRADFKRQEVIANNLANINTPGFRAEIYQAETQYMNGTNGAIGPAFSSQSPNGIDFTPGELIHTGNDLDVAIDGDGWIAVKDSEGKEGYTRAGNLRIDANGQLITASGKAVLGDGGPIAIPPSRSVEIGTDGTITVAPLGGDVKSLAILDRIKLVKLDKTNVIKGEDGLLKLKDGGKAQTDSTIKLVNGAYEGSNVNAIDQMVQMIGAGREFDAHMQLLSKVDSNSQKLAQLLHE